MTSPDASLPSLPHLLASMRVLRIPMNTRFRGVTSREVALFEAPNGWVEFSPFLEYGPHEAATWLASTLDAGWLPQPDLRRTCIPVNATLPDVPAGRVPDVMSRYGNLDTLHTVKVKVGGAHSTFDDDVARLDALRALVGDGVKIRVDVNGTWDLDEALSNLSSLERFELEYAEQPVMDVEDLARLRDELARRGIDIAIAADESIRKASDPLRVAALGAADLIIVKAQPLGGARRILQIVEQTGLPAVVSSALDSAVGIAFGARVAAALPDLPYACGLGTGALFSDDVTPPWSADGSTPGHTYNFTTTPGWVVPDPAALTRLEAPRDRREWWGRRVEACFDVALRRARDLDIAL
ncbi:o-succinylbenzoate synthase [Arcanobacterium haemolyticum]|nr:o-succinylbenzoate synthase [Arcanobacterium haemolyticum]